MWEFIEINLKYLGASTLVAIVFFLVWYIGYLIDNKLQDRKDKKIKHELEMDDLKRDVRILQSDIRMLREVIKRMRESEVPNNETK